MIAVAFVAAVASYTHMLDLARHAGEGRLALLLPISVDGLVVAGSTTMVVRRHHGLGGGWLAWLAVSLGIGASLAANVVAVDPSLVDPDVVRRVIAGWPPVALAHRRRTRDRAALRQEPRARRRRLASNRTWLGRSGRLHRTR